MIGFMASDLSSMLASHFDISLVSIFIFANIATKSVSLYFDNSDSFDSIRLSISVLRSIIGLIVFLYLSFNCSTENLDKSSAIML